MTDSDWTRQSATVEAATLSNWLRNCGTLSRGDVAEVSLDLRTDTGVSCLDFVKVKYAGAVPPDLPERLVIKRPLGTPLSQDTCSAEALFYRRHAGQVGTPPTVRCLAAIEAVDRSPSTIVLEDLRTTHYHPPWPVPPSEGHCRLALDGLARVHAHW